MSRASTWMVVFLLLGATVGSFFLPASCQIVPTTDFGKPNVLRIGGHLLYVEVASTRLERARGLMYRSYLPEDRGMIFVYPRERVLSFWMKNVRIPLSVAFLDRKGVILSIQQMAVEAPEAFSSSSPTYRTYVSPRPAKYAIETNGGWFRKRGIRVGDRVEGLENLRFRVLEP